MKSKKKTLCELMMIILSMSLVSCSGGESSKNSVYTNNTTSSIKTSDTGGSDSNSITMISFSEASIISLSFFAHDASLVNCLTFTLLSGVR